MLEAGNQKKIFTPLIGKGVNFFINGKPADEVSKKKFNEISSMLKEAEKSLDNNSDFSKSEIKELRSIIKEINNTEKSKVTYYVVDLAKKIREYSENNK
jgi:ElaB/YqjD/DUF883 family membrane-anchored ribosome-binding protein